MSETAGRPADTSPVIALTGATGFVGRSLLSHLAGMPVRVRALARPRAGRRLDDTGALHWIEGGLSDDEALARLVDGAGTVIHLAGVTKAHGGEGFHRDNVVATARLAAASRRAGVAHFIHVSSLAARRADLSAYASSKASSEMAARVQSGAMALTIVRPPAVIGPGDEASAPLLALIAQGFLPAPPQDEVERRVSLVDVEDLAHCLCVLATGKPGPALIEPCSVASLTWAQLAEAAGRATGRPVRLLRLPALVWHAAGQLSRLAGALTGRPAHFGPGKVRELLSGDWTCGPVLPEAAPLEATLRRSLTPVDAACGSATRA